MGVENVPPLDLGGGFWLQFIITLEGTHLGLNSSLLDVYYTSVTMYTFF